jgi:hypothetical protein
MKLGYDQQDGVYGYHDGLGDLGIIVGNRPNDR